MESSVFYQNRNDLLAYKISNLSFYISRILLYPLLSTVDGLEVVRRFRNRHAIVFGQRLILRLRWFWIGHFIALLIISTSHFIYYINCGSIFCHCGSMIMDTHNLLS